MNQHITREDIRDSKAISFIKPQTFPKTLFCVHPRFRLAVIGMICIIATLQSLYGLGPQQLNAGTSVREIGEPVVNSCAADIASRRSASSQAGTHPFWQYSIFGSSIGLSNIIIRPAPTSGSAQEIIIGAKSELDGGPDDFWQVVCHNSATGNYDQLFVSQTYSAPIKRIALGNVGGDSQEKIAVMLEDGRIYLYDSGTRTELGHIRTGINGLEGFSLTDLDGDGSAELIVTTANDLFLFDREGTLLWQVSGAGGYDVVVGQMDNDPALEIVATRGRVVDAATHSTQWTFTGYASQLRLAPLPGSSYQQLIVAQGTNVNVYDVATQLLRWTVHLTYGYGPVEIADADGDNIPEVIVADGPFAPIQVRDLLTQALKWTTDNPEYGITNIAVGDVDNDGEVDLLWGSGWDSTGPDYLCIASTTGGHAIKWQNIDLVGPFAGPAIGDLDGDGQPELVSCSYASDGGNKGGRILVFDLASLTLRGMSEPIVIDPSAGVRDLKLRDLDGDGHLEIVLATDRTQCGLIKIYSFDSSNAFTLQWTNTSCISGSPFTFVEVADLDNNGIPEVITGNSVASTGTAGVCIYIYDYPSPQNPWRSLRLAPAFEALTGLVVEDLDGNGSKEIAALVSTGYLYTFDGPTRQLRAKTLLNNASAISRRSPSGLIVANYAGVGHFFEYSNNFYAESFRRRLAPGNLQSINVLPDGQLWTGASKTLGLWLPPAYGNVVWQSPVFGTGFGRFVATDYRNGQNRVFSSSQNVVAGFTFESDSPGKQR